ncbi:DUF1302 domain-containing protein [Massilia pseudoviolaceinigra]|uniref:DUF1302 domain-containing protein n=1 Tax=Massilia pseudoviolaceinigra TaxID=3057165 RepID=UPI002796D636|nr:DUF1302 family protein [Massilia sp. CCM 9206]MDQ1923508.1 DUF1302 family protein [Massilia sp. CCM 9206]
MHRPRRRHFHAAFTLAALAGTPAYALETNVSGRLGFGASFRTEASAPHMLVPYNAAAVGLSGVASAGQNSDDANLNFRRGDAVSRTLKGYIDLTAGEGGFSALVRVKAWHDFALSDHERAWGNSINGYAAGRPLDDAGGARLSRFSGVALGDVFVQHSAQADGARMLARLGQQSLAWGERGGFPGGLSAINAVDFPARRRADAVPQESLVPAPMLFARVEAPSGVGIEGFYQFRFRPSAMDLCGTFWATTDYVAQGCNQAFAGPMPVSDRVRLARGAFVKRMDNPDPVDERQYGAALTWKSAPLALDVGLYHARYTSRNPLPGVRKAQRTGTGLIAGDPDGKNMRYFTEYPGGIGMTSLTLAHRRAHGSLFGELTYRPNQPIQLPPGDTLPAFLNPAIVTLLRKDVDALAPGALYHTYDRYRTFQLQAGVQQDWPMLGGIAVSTLGEVVVKHVAGLPDPTVRRYGRADQYGNGPVNGACQVTSSDAARQCSADGYVSPTAHAYRVRVDARMAQVLKGLNLHAWAQLQHEVKGWSYDFVLSEGRRTMNIGLRMEYLKRYVAEVAYLPVWGGVYNTQVDRDVLSVSMGVKF